MMVRGRKEKLLEDMDGQLEGCTGCPEEKEDLWMDMGVGGSYDTIAVRGPRDP